MSKTFGIAMIVTCCLGLGLTPPTAPLETTHDCVADAVEWTYTNHTNDSVTINKQRLRIPGYPIDTTLDATARVLTTGASWHITYPGIAVCQEGEPCDLTNLDGFPDGTYTVDVWLTNGVTDWFIKQQTNRTCEVER